jgi:hypothetical protein
MPLSTDKLPNSPLTGPELKSYTASLLRDELEIRSVPPAVSDAVVGAMSSGMDRDYLFAEATAYPLVQITIEVRLHYANGLAAFTVKPSYVIQNPMAPTHEVFVRSSAPPLTVRSEDEGIEAFTLTTTVENPNLVRIHYGLPIEITRRAHPKPNEMFPRFETETLEYVPADFPEPTGPVVKDETEHFATIWRVDKPSTAPETTEGALVSSPRRRRGRAKKESSGG